MLLTRASRVLLAASITCVATVVSAQPIAITGGKVHPVSGPAIDNGTVVITDGKITAVGAGVAVPAGARVIDAKGKWVTPGLFNPTTTLGLREVGSEPGSTDDSARGDHGVAAAFRAWDGLNATSTLWAPARNEGVTTVGALPNGGLIAGQGAVVDTLPGRNAADMIRKAPAVMVASLASAQEAETDARGELFMRLREVFDDARLFDGRREAFDNGAVRDLAVHRLHLAALQQVLSGRMPVLIAVHRAADIEAALELARDYKLRIGILGGAEAWMVAPQLAAARVPVFTTALDSIPTSFTTLGQRQENAGLLRKGGVAVGLMVGAGESFNVRNIRQHAGNAVAYGMTWDDALRAVTLTPAEFFGVADAIGTLEVGKDANVVVWDGDPFEFATRAVNVFIRGRDVQGPSRQDMLTERYLPKKP